MREIKFRGKRTDNGEWVYGLPAFNRNYSGIDKIEVPALSGGVCTLVDPETVGQYTGLKDRNGKEIYEGDVISYLSGGNQYKSKVWFDEDCGCYLVENPTVMLLDHAKRHAELIGNIY